MASLSLKVPCVVCEQRAWYHAARIPRIPLRVALGWAGARPRPGDSLTGRLAIPTSAAAARGSLRRDVRIIGLVGAAHFVSHFFQLALPPLFPLLRDDFGVTYVQLGLLMSLFYAASGIGQTASGFLVDHFGARRVLPSGMALLAFAMALAGLAPSYWALVAVALVGGLGNSVFHPADYSIFNASVSPTRLGRAYGVHSICGNLGWVLAPVVVVGLSAAFGWRVALLTVGGLGVAAALAVSTQGDVLDDRRELAGLRSVPVGGWSASVKLLMARPILIAFAYFALLATSQIGIQTFSVSAMVAIYEAPLGLATGALTAFFVGSAAGILLGAFLADRTSRHDLLASGGMCVGALASLAMASAVPPLAVLPVLMALAGFCLGATTPARDMLVRAATPPGASGKVYGFVYSGLDLGSALTPLLFGWLLDKGEPRMVFVASAAFMLLTIATVVQVHRQAAPAGERVPAHR
jgi:FSR family fosmidomycin resistance protein-like MFS transporter